MIAYKIPSGQDGILCALFESFTLKEKPIAVFSGDFQPSFDCRVKQIEIFSKNAERVKKGIIKCGGISLLSALFYLLRSSDELAETVLFNVAYKCLSARKNLLDNFSDADILTFYELKNKISYETHRLLGFVRFEKSDHGIWYAHIAPDNNVVDLIAPHFKGRFPDDKFIIHDVKRNILSAYDGTNIHTFASDKPITVFLDRGEIEFQNLWRTYFNAVTIKERKNEKLQSNYLPSRYRKNMTEFLNGFDTDITSRNSFSTENAKSEKNLKKQAENSKLLDVKNVDN